MGEARYASSAAHAAKKEVVGLEPVLTAPPKTRARRMLTPRRAVAMTGDVTVARASTTASRGEDPIERSVARAAEKEKDVEEEEEVDEEDDDLETR